jgi:DNA-binding winged helix-turn-helix (wHTH) protein/tetratricopeptide (TPR) repeat protein
MRTPESASTMKTSRVTSFDGWKLHADIGELIKDGRKIRLQQRPLLVLEELLAHPGELVTREQLIARLWPKGVVDFDTGLNTAVRKLRVALDDVDDVPRYIETIPRKGYRFLGTIDPSSEAPPPPSPTMPPVDAPREPQGPVAAAADLPPADRRLADRRATDSTLERASAAPRRLTAYWLAFGTAALIAIGLAYVVQHRSGVPSPGPREVVVQRPPTADVAMALLPLVSASSNAPDEPLGRIVSDVLRLRLGKLAGVIIIGATSLPPATMDQAALRQFGESVHARYLLTGSVTRSRGSLQVALELLDAATGNRLESFAEAGPESDLAGLIDRVVRNVARKVPTDFDASRASAAPAAINLEAYGIYLQAQDLMKNQRVADTRSAVELFRRATVLEPRFARAYLGVAQALVLSSGFGNTSKAEDSRNEAEANVALDRALTLDPELGEVLIERARFTEDSTEADKLYREGLRLAPNYARGYQRYAEFLNDEYRLGEALEAIERAYAIDPLEPRVIIRLAMLRYFADSDAAAHDRLLAEALAINPKHALALEQLGMSRWFNAGEVADGIRLLEQAVGLDPSADWLKNTLVTMYLDVDDPGAAQAVLKQCVSATYSAVEVAQYQRDRARAAQLARSVPLSDWRTRWGVPEAWALRDEAIRTGDFTLALERMDQRFALNVPWGPKKTVGPRFWNRGLGLVFAHTLKLAGDAQRGDRLARMILAQLDGESVGRAPNYLSRDRAAAFAIIGDKDRALAELAKSLAVGHHSYWWYYGELDPLFTELRSDPRFDALLARAKEHRVRQRALLDELRRTGQVPRR